MMTDFGVIDLKEQEFAPLGLSAGHVTDLITALSQIITATGASPADLLSIYTPETIVWELPPLRGGKLVEVSLNVQPSEGEVSNLGFVYDLYIDLIETVRKHGFGPQAEEKLSAAFGPRALHPLIFTRTEASPRALPLFGIEWACYLENRSNEAIIQSNHACVKLAPDMYIPFMGVVNGICSNSEVVDEAFINECLEAQRGFIVFDTFDALDRAYLWAIKNTAKLEELQKVLRGLCLLKLGQSHLTAYRFEQALRNLRPPAKVEPTMKSLLYSDAALDTIRDIWYTGDDSYVVKLDRLHQTLVPSYLDDIQFKTLFKHMPASTKRVSRKAEATINRGLEKFVALFLQTRRAISEGKQVRMEG